MYIGESRARGERWWRQHCNIKVVINFDGDCWMQSERERCWWRGGAAGVTVNENLVFLFKRRALRRMDERFIIKLYGSLLGALPLNVGCWWKSHLRESNNFIPPRPSTLSHHTDASFRSVLSFGLRPTKVLFASVLLAGRFERRFNGPVSSRALKVG